MKAIGELAEPTLFADRQARSGADAPVGQRQGREGVPRRDGQGQARRRASSAWASRRRYRWKDSVQSEAEIRIWFADGVANGLRPWFTKFARRAPRPPLAQGRRGPLPLAPRRRAVPAERAAARPRGPGLLAADRLVLRRPAGAGRRSRTTRWAWYQALVEARIPFEMVHDRLLDATHLARFKTLILPNIAALSDEQCRQLRAFVERGGGLVATYETSLYDEWGAAREDFGLADLFGVSFRRPGRGADAERLPAARATTPHRPAHPLLAGLEDAPRIIHGDLAGWTSHRGRVPEPAADADPELPGPADGDGLPARPEDRRRRGVPRARSAPGRVVYFPWDIDRIFWEVLAVDHGRCSATPCAWATRRGAAGRVTGPGVLDVTVWRQEGSMTVHLVNLTNPMMMRGTLREFFPVGPLRVRVRVPEGTRPTGVRLLGEGNSPDSSYGSVPSAESWRGSPDSTPEGRLLEVTVPSVECHEIIAVDLAVSE